MREVAHKYKRKKKGLTDGKIGRNSNGCWTDTVEVSIEPAGRRSPNRGHDHDLRQKSI